MKKEIRHIWGPIEGFSRSEMRTILFDYIEVFYNGTRRHSDIGYQSPRAFERLAA